jgi:hypothetical protein
MSDYVWPKGSKWTEGEVRRIVYEEEDGRAALEILNDLCSKGRDVVVWGEMRDPTKEDEQARERELAEYDAENAKS